MRGTDVGLRSSPRWHPSDRTGRAGPWTRCSMVGTAVLPETGSTHYSQTGLGPLRKSTVRCSPSDRWRTAERRSAIRSSSMAYTRGETDRGCCYADDRGSQGRNAATIMSVSPTSMSEAKAGTRVMAIPMSTEPIDSVTSESSLCGGLITREILVAGFPFSSVYVRRSVL